MAVMLGGGAAICAMAGVVLLWSEAVPAAAGEAGLRTPRVSATIWLLLFGALLAIGQLIIRGGAFATALAIPPLHFAAALLPALALTARLQWRSRFRRIAYGSCAAAGIALLVEMIVVIGLGTVVAFVTMQSPQGRETLARLQELVASSEPGQTAELEGALSSLASPALLAAAALLFGLVGPAIEELAKLSGVVLARPPSARQAWLQGLAVGAGFGVTEAVALGATGVAAWPATMVLRSAATMMHATMTGLSALGWHSLVAQGAHRRGLAAIGLAIVGHGAWNSLVLVMALAALGVLPGQIPVLAGAAGGALSGLVLLWGLILAGYLVIEHRFRIRGAAATER
jgi:hypothetical protein